MSLKQQKALATGKIISDPCAKFVPHTPFSDLQDKFDLLLYRRRAELETGRSSEARGIVLIGNSGSGKSTAMSHLFNRHKDLARLEPKQDKGGGDQPIGSIPGNAEARRNVMPKCNRLPNSQGSNFRDHLGASAKPLKRARDPFLAS